MGRSTTSRRVKALVRVVVAVLVLAALAWVVAQSREGDAAGEVGSFKWGKLLAGIAFVAVAGWLSEVLGGRDWRGRKIVQSEADDAASGGA